jgi:hypothetical protein
VHCPAARTTARSARVGRGEAASDGVAIGRMVSLVVLPEDALQRAAYEERRQ